MGELEVTPDDVAMPYVCPWCGDRFAARHRSRSTAMSLEEHWLLSPACLANRNTVSSMRPDAQTFGVPPTQPGQHTLDRIRHVDEER